MKLLRIFIILHLILLQAICSAASIEATGEEGEMQNDIEVSLQKSSPEMLEKIKSKLANFGASNAKISYGKSPRKAIKNGMIPYNGYYRLDFDSKTDKTHYSCDISYTTNYPYRNEDGTARPYVMNCKNSNDSSVFPTEVQRILVEDIKNKKKKYGTLDLKDYSPEVQNIVAVYNGGIEEGTVEVSSNIGTVASTALLIDDTPYSVRFKNKGDGKTYYCTVVLAMDNESYGSNDRSLEDQRVDYHSCRVIKDVEQPNFKNSKGCYESPNGLEKNLSLNKNVYDFINEKLQRDYPLPDKNAVDCKNDDINYWKSFADKMISTDKIKFKSKDPDSLALEKAVVQNALINQAYNRLYVSSRNNQSGASPLQWLSVASQSSPLVGKVIRKGYQKQGDSDAVIKSPGLKNTLRHDESFMADAGFLAGKLIKQKQVISQTAQGNLDVYKDMYWQNFAAAYCGPAKAQSLSAALRDSYQKQGNAELAEHYKKLENAWNQINNGFSSKPQNEQMIANGNSQLLWLEQHDILQKKMYESNGAKVANSLGVFNSLAKTTFSDSSKAKIPSFNEYCKSEKISCNLSDFNSRFSWMKSLVGEQTKYIQSSEAKGTLKNVYLPTLYESSEILADYH